MPCTAMYLLFYKSPLFVVRGYHSLEKIMSRVVSQELSGLVAIIVGGGHGSGGCSTQHHRAPEVIGLIRPELMLRKKLDFRFPRGIVLIGFELGPLSFFVRGLGSDQAPTGVIGIMHGGAGTFLGLPESCFE